MPREGIPAGPARAPPDRAGVSYALVRAAARIGVLLTRPEDSIAVTLRRPSRVAAIQGIHCLQTARGR